MSFFFHRKNSSETSKKEVSTQLSLTCPQCGFLQKESSMAVSTYCRGCREHYKIIDGKAVKNKKNPSNPYASLKDASSEPRVRKTDDSSTPVSSLKKKQAPSTPSKPQTSPPPTTSNLVKKAAASTGFFQSKVTARDVVCFECNREHQAPAEASSTLCPACGAYIGLKDYDIRNNWNRRIQTRGNVTIQKKASVTGITIRCHHLTVIGKLTGGVDCSGDFTLRSHGKIMGTVHCKRLIIEKRAQVEFSNPVICEEIIVDGIVTGNFTCSGKLHLKKKASLTGDIKVATMVVEEGARHSGQLSIGQ